MPENIRSLIVIVVIATTFFVLSSRYLTTVSEPADFTRRRNIWLGLTFVAFLGHSFWIYTVIAILLLIYANRRESNPPALFFFLLFVLPVATVDIPGIGPINYLFELSHQRILALFVLFPVYLSLKRQSDIIPFGRTGADKALFAYLLLTAILCLRDTSLTNSLRQAFYLVIDVFLPYFVISRSLKDMKVFRDALLSLVVAIMIVAALAVIEFLKHWLLYASLMDVLKLDGMTGYLGRDGMLRANVTAGQAIALGYLMVVGLGLYLFIQSYIQRNFIRRLGMLLLAAGLITPLSRGPWIGAAVLIVIFIVTGRYAARRLMILALILSFTLPLLSVLPGGERVINLLPFIGTTEKGNIDYREQLITNSMIVIKRNLWFGSVDFLKTPEMEAMRQGQGIIDIVNNYIQVALATGLVGLVFFVSFFALTLASIYGTMRSISDRDSEEYLLGRSLLATLVAILFIIFTVANITIIPIVYWSVAGMGAAYTQMVRNIVVRI